MTDVSSGIGWLFGGGLVGLLGAYLGIRRDARDVEDREKKRDEEMKKAFREALNSELRLVESESKNIRELMSVVRDSVSALNITIESKLATKQDVLAISNRLESVEVRLNAHDRTMLELQISCSRCKARDVIPQHKGD